jgi:hypothetical protein
LEAFPSLTSGLHISGLLSASPMVVVAASSSVVTVLVAETGGTVLVVETGFCLRSLEVCCMNMTNEVSWEGLEWHRNDEWFSLT